MRTSEFQLLLTSHYFRWVTTGTLTYTIPPESLVSVPCTCSKGKEEAGLGFMMRKWTDSSRDPGVSDRAGGGRNVSRKLEHLLCRQCSLEKGSGGVENMLA